MLRLTSTGTKVQKYMVIVKYQKATMRTERDKM